MIHIKNPKSGINVFKALSSEVRLDIISLLVEHQTLNLDEISKKLNLTNGAITHHIKKLEESGLIVIETSGGKHGLQKNCFLNEHQIQIDIVNENPAENLYEATIKVGHYVAFHAQPTCGLATKDSIIGTFDDPRYFADPQHVNAEILWLTEGYVEYWIPNYLKPHQVVDEIQIITELGSEAPAYNNNYPSDIYFYLNGIELGYWTSPGDFGDQRGKQNPDWWPPHLNQYGTLKLIRVNKTGTFIDGFRISDTSINDICINGTSEIRLRVGVPEHANNRGGMTIYGSSYGNYKQDITARVLLTNNKFS